MLSTECIGRFYQRTWDLPLRAWSTWEPELNGTGPERLEFVFSRSAMNGRDSARMYERDEDYP
jgi:hypothetical protein